MPRICSRCGKEIPEDLDFCESCGGPPDERKTLGLKLDWDPDAGRYKIIFPETVKYFSSLKDLKTFFRLVAGMLFVEGKKAKEFRFELLDSSVKECKFICATCGRRVSITDDTICSICGGNKWNPWSEEERPKGRYEINSL